ncbi:MAG: peptidoglycan bridge formation glycyltransferase FemA/FemB family protein [Ruminococcaceae bacterium]|nr:peptidoglycan bridge formation glycyltransferase FemA/FemB family protein [Oscillospiraceae bacterium]
MEILKKEEYGQFERFLRSQPDVSFMQSAAWRAVKDRWKHEVVVVRDEMGEIVGGMSVLIRTVFPGMTLLYAPRGPVCDLSDEKTVRELLRGAQKLAEKYHAFALKIDPEVPESDRQTIRTLHACGFFHRSGAAEYETVQRRYNYVLLNLYEKSGEELLQSFKPKCRYNIRLAQRSGMVCKVQGSEGLDDFYALYESTGQRAGFSVRSKEYCRKLLEAFGRDARIFTAYQGETPVASALMITYAGRTSYLFGGSTHESHSKAGHAVMYEAIRWAAVQGCDTFDFMAVPVNLDEKSPMYGVYRFKSGFNGEVKAFAGEFDYVFRPYLWRCFCAMQKGKSTAEHLLHKITDQADD